jgi:hypothetical protein
VAGVFILFGRKTRHEILLIVFIFFAIKTAQNKICAENIKEVETILN